MSTDDQTWPSPVIRPNKTALDTDRHSSSRNDGAWTSFGGFRRRATQMMTNYHFEVIDEAMAQIDVNTLLDPLGPELQKAAQGTPNEARVAVAVHWPQIEKALDSGFTISAIYRVLSKAGLVAVTLRSFTRQVKARREGAGGAGTAAKSAGLAPVIENPEGPKPANKADGRPQPKWMTVPYEDPDPKAVFKERDPLVDD